MNYSFLYISYSCVSLHCIFTCRIPPTKGEGTLEPRKHVQTMLVCLPAALPGIAVWCLMSIRWKIWNPIHNNESHYDNRSKKSTSYRLHGTPLHQALIPSSSSTNEPQNKSKHSTKSSSLAEFNAYPIKPSTTYSCQGCSASPIPNQNSCLDSTFSLDLKTPSTALKTTEALKRRIFQQSTSGSNCPSLTSPVSWTGPLQTKTARSD